MASAAVAAGGVLSPEEQWRVSMECVAQAGDPEAAKKCARECGAAAGLATSGASMGQTATCMAGARAYLRFEPMPEGSRWVSVAMCRLQEVPNNYYRLLRVLEIVQRTGRRMSELDIDEAWTTLFQQHCRQSVTCVHRPGSSSDPILTAIV